MPKCLLDNHSACSYVIVVLAIMWLCWFVFPLLSHIASTPGTSPQKQFTHNQLVVEDMEAPCGQPLPDAISTPTKILINGIPAEERSETTLMYYLQSLLAPQAPNCNVKLYGEKAVATFIGTISKKACLVISIVICLPLSSNQSLNRQIAGY